jgi:hypothetical protein
LRAEVADGLDRVDSDRKSFMYTAPIQLILNRLCQYWNDHLGMLAAFGKAYCR